MLPNAKGEGSEQWDCSKARPTAQLPEERRSPVSTTHVGVSGRRESELLVLASRAGFSPCPNTSHVSNAHLSNGDAVGVRVVLLPTGVGVVKWGDVPMGLGLVARPGCWRVRGRGEDG